MLSDDMTRFVDLHRRLGFKFHTQHGLLRSFVAFAEAHGDEYAATVCSIGPARHLHHRSAATELS
jgi:hypothetical protein